MAGLRSDHHGSAGRSRSEAALFEKFLLLAAKLQHEGLGEEIT